MKDKNIYIENLALELTRQCNLSCRHCSRGEAENHIMSDEIIEKLFEEITSIGCLQFIGGESSLVVNKINKLAQVLEEKQVDVFSCLVFTNATNVSDEYIEALKQLKKVVQASNERNPKSLLVKPDFTKTGLTSRYSKDFALQVVVSLDKYHIESIDKHFDREKVKQNIDRLVQNFTVEIDKMCNFTIFNEGRAKNLENCYKCKTPILDYAASCYMLKGENIPTVAIGPVVSISYDGKIVDSNKSYDYNDLHNHGSLNDKSFYEMFKMLKSDKRVTFCKRSYKQFENKCYKISHKLNATTKELTKMAKYSIKHNLPLDYKYLTTDEIAGYEELDNKPNKPQEKTLSK